MIVDPVTIGPDHLIADALDVMRRYKISGVPVTQGKRLSASSPIAICGLKRAPISHRRRDDEGKPDHRAGGHHPRRSGS